METIRKILAPTDMSSLSAAGLGYAFELAEEHKAELLVYHVIEPEEAAPHDEGYAGGSWGKHLPEWMIKERAGMLSEFLKENFAALLPRATVRLEVEIGLPWRMIVAKAKKEAADMIVMSTHGRTGLKHLIMGSVTETVVRRAPCPVVSIHPEKERAERARNHKPVRVARSAA